MYAPPDGRQKFIRVRATRALPAFACFLTTVGLLSLRLPAEPQPLEGVFIDARLLEVEIPVSEARGRLSAVAERRPLGCFQNGAAFGWHAQTGHRVADSPVERLQSHL